MNFLTQIGASCIKSLRSLGEVSFFILRIFQNLRSPFYLNQFIKQLFNIGYFSLPVVTLTAFFTGMVLALQTHTGFIRFSATEAVPTVVALSIVRELGPVLAALMVCGRVSASIAAELGTMRVSDQIDAMLTLQTSPFKYLIIPRVLAATITLPILVLVGDIIGIWGGYLISTLRLGFNEHLYIDLTFKYLKNMDVISGLIKSGVFGLCLSVMGCYYGFYSSNGAYGVGKSTTKAVVSSSILVLITNYILTALFFTG